MAQTLTHARRAATERVIKEWTGEWKTAEIRGQWAAANRLAPSLKPTPHFKNLYRKREVFGRLVQCRTGHGYTGEFYKRFVPSENTDCACGERNQTREHILRTCPLYEAHRNLLRQASRDIALPEILGTKTGILALAKFLENSGAFTKTGHPRPKAKPPDPEDEPDPMRNDEPANADDSEDEGSTDENTA